MPGTQDHVAEREHSPDPARPREPDHPRESRAQPSDLQARLERLPVGHPSSPYRDDGSRKPPAPDLAQYELPLPDELPPDPDQPDQDLQTEDKARLNPDGSWDWKGRHLSPEESRVANQALTKACDNEGRDSEGNYGDHGLTPAMRRIEAHLASGHLVEDTEQHALKEPDRFKEKLADSIARNPDKSAAELAYEIPDAVRYTFTFPEENYCEGMWDVHRRAEEQGYELEVRRNSWASAEYKGINCRWFDNTSGQLFEIQFHTQASWEAKQLTHHAYERFKDPRTPPSEVQHLRVYQKGISGSVGIPPGAVDIPDYRKEGR
jgi:hypothetical protein